MLSSSDKTSGNHTWPYRVALDEDVAEDELFDVEDLPTKPVKVLLRLRPELAKRLTEITKAERKRLAKLAIEKGEDPPKLSRHSVIIRMLERGAATYGETHEAETETKKSKK